jgi:hypothetical protein
MPSMQKLYNDYNTKIEFIFISGERQATVDSFLNKKNYNLKTYKPVNNYPEVFNVKSLPRTFLIDTKGNIVIDKMGAANWDSDTVRNTIDELLDING